MKTFLVRAQKEKEKKKKILSRLGPGNEEMGFVKIQVKRAKLKRNRKSLFPRLTSSPFARVNHSRIGRKCSSTSPSFFRET